LSRKVSYPVGLKLNCIITLALLFSLGAEILLVAVFVRFDVKTTAMGNNRSINSMSATMAALEFTALRSDVLILLNYGGFDDTATPDMPAAYPAAPQGESARTLGALIQYFFRQQPDIAAIVLPDETDASGGGDSSYLNEPFMAANEARPSMIDDFLRANPVAISRARIGETMLMNAAPFFNGLQMLALIFPKRGAGQSFMPVAVFFSSQDFTESFGTGAHSSFLTNDSGDVLIHSDQDLVAEGANVMAESFVRDCWNSGQQTMHGVFQNADGMSIFGDFERVEGFQNAAVFTTIQSDIVFEGVSAATRRNIAFSAMITFLSVLFIWFFSKTFSRPLVELANAVEEIDHGNYQIQLASHNADETGVLGSSLMSMSHAIGNFERFTNKMIARLSREGTLKAEGTDKVATLFFSDIRSFTAISEKMRAEEVVEFLNEYMERMVSCVIATGGAIDKYIGDAIMAHWGPVESAGNAAVDALNGVRSALMMRANLFNFNARRSGDDRQPKIKIGCGLNTGNVLAGQIGSAERVVYTVIGDAVSFADRTETFNKPFGTEILISEHTWRLVGKYLITQEMPSVTEAGERVRIFAVINMADEEESERMLTLLDAMSFNDPALNRRCLGPGGPQTLAQLRTLLSIPTPDLSQLNLAEEEKKYSLAPASIETAALEAV
jgi:adenylate cyclase